VTSHIRALYEIKELFSKLKTSTSSRDIALYSNNISKISLVQKSTYSRYSYIISEHPEAKVIHLLMYFWILVKIFE